MLKKVFIFISLIAFQFSLYSLSIKDGGEILKKVDNLLNLETDFQASVSLVTNDPEKGIDKQDVQLFRRDREDKFLLLIKAPNVKKGQGYLKLDDNTWFYDPQSRKFSHTSLKESFSGSNANNEDFRSSNLSDDYNVEKVEESKLGKYDVYVLDLKARNKTVTYDKKKLWVQKGKVALLLKSQDFSVSGRLLRTSYYAKYTPISNKYFPSFIMFKDELVKGQKTQLTLKNISVADIPNNVFTKAYVERVNR